MADARIRTLRGRLVRHGVTAGIVAGIVFALLEMVAARTMGGSALGPWRAFASVVLGAAAMSPARVPPGTAVLAGILVHLAVSMLLGALFSVILGAFRERQRQSYGLEVWLGLLFGVGVYLLDFQVIARAFFPWFLRMPQGPQVLLHALGYGLVLGLFLAWAERHEPSSTLVTPSP